MIYYIWFFCWADVVRGMQLVTIVATSQGAIEDAKRLVEQSTKDTQHGQVYAYIYSRR